MKKKIALIALVAALLGTGAALAMGSGAGKDPTRADCPGQIICPLTGEPVCADRCPLRAALKDAEPQEGDCPLCKGSR